jgi:hypothetical protein
MELVYYAATQYTFTVHNQWCLPVAVPQLFILTFQTRTPALTIINASFCIQGFPVTHRVNIDHFLEQRQPVDFCNGEVLCSL